MELNLIWMILVDKIATVESKENPKHVRENRDDRVPAPGQDIKTLRPATAALVYHQRSRPSDQARTRRPRLVAFPP